jgi:hypothetical protein
MPRVLLPGESDATTQQEREECMQAFRDTADHVLSRHHRAFLGAFKQMMVAVFGPGMEQVFNKTPIQGGTVEMGESSSQPPLQSQPAQPPPQSAGSQAFQPPPQGAGGQPVQPPLQAAGGRPVQPPPQGSTGQPMQQPKPYQPTYGELAFGSPGPRLLPATGLLQQATGCRGICMAEATTRWGTTEPSMLSRIRVTDQLQARRRTISWRERWPI